MKTGILGGTFNPIHTGHIEIAECVFNALKLDRVIFIPTGISYKKLDLKVLPKDIRFELVKTAISDYPYFEVSDIELKKDGYSYTCDTLKELHGLYPSDEFYYIIGTDNLFAIDSWNEPQIIFDNCIITVVARGDYDNESILLRKKYLEDEYGAYITILHNDKIDISSTYIRNSMLSGDFDNAKEMLNKKTYDFIISNKLFEYWK